MRVLVSRTDRIGDVVLTLPLCGLLRAHLGAEVLFLARRYTRPVVEASPFVDAVLDWDAVATGSGDRQRDFLRELRADVILHVFPRREVARAARAAGIPRRIGTSHRFYHWLYCNELEHFSRRRSQRHEAQLNARLAAPLLRRVDWDVAELTPFCRLEPQVPVPPRVAALLEGSRFNLVVHPKSRGSGREWPLEHWAALIAALPEADYRVFITGSPEERHELREWLRTLPPQVVDLTSSLNLAELVALLAAADGVVAASTGPLHVAAAAGANTLGLFAPTPPINPARWAPLGPRAVSLSAPRACSGCGSGRAGSERCQCMRAIPVRAVVERVEAWARAVRRRAG